MKRFVLISVILVSVGLLAWQVGQRIFSGKGQARQRNTMPVAVKVASVEKRTIRDTGLFTGTLHPQSQYVVAPKIAGRLEKLFVNIGDRVRRGQVIARLENDEYVKQVDQARAELEVAKANLEESRSTMEIARREFERARTLREKKIASESELDTAQAHMKTQEAKHRVAIAQFAQKEAALKTAEVRLSYTEICACWEEQDDNRVVGERFVDEGAMLAANASIVSILDIRALIGVFHVIERDYSKVSVGQVASLTTDAFLGRSFSGKVVRIAPLLKETSRQARVEIEVLNEEGLLKPGMFVRIQIGFAKRENATVVPQTALVKRDARQGVFLADLKFMKAHFVVVTPGLVADEWVEVVQPPLSGQVVVLGQHLLKEGTEIVLPNGPPGSAPGAARGEPQPGPARGSKGPG
ncbi:MAG: efflux RND transporter periplasmic adaptor subunit [Deltaproteobacteria bacterium]|nr:efflux RND transporter periplasmic adaptor subunit [Deltaproteobacteria bacterium]